jgi:hypothetical protein
MFLETTAKTPSWLVGHNQRDSQVAPRRKASHMTSSVWELKLGFEWGVRSPPGNRLSRLLTIAESTGTMFL